SARCRSSRPCPIGSKPRISLAFRAKREVLALLVNQGLQHLADHAEVIAMPLELPLQVDQIGGRGIETLGQQFADEECDLRIGLQKLLGILEYEHADG